MRTTLTIDPDVARLLDEEVHRTRRPRKQVVNDALRRGLSSSTGTRLPPYRVVPHRTKLRAGIDVERLSELADELEDEAILRPRARKAGA